MRIISKNGEGLNFLESGVEGLYILDHVAFVAPFDKNCNNDWNKSSGKKKLQEWAEENLPKEILERFDVDLPSIEEVFSQKTLNAHKPVKELKSKQLPIFQDDNHRKMKLNGRQYWWWTKTANNGLVDHVWSVYADGTVDIRCAEFALGFVPVLRKKGTPKKREMSEALDAFEDLMSVYFDNDWIKKKYGITEETARKKAEVVRKELEAFDKIKSLVMGKENKG